MEGCVFPLPYTYSKFLFYSSFLFGLSFIFAIFLHNIYAVVYWFLLCLSSTNHWKNPDYDIKRKFDLFIVSIGICNNIYYIYNLPSEFYKKMFLYLFICTIFFHFMSCLLMSFHSTKWIIFHMSMHIYVAVMSLFMFIM